MMTFACKCMYIPGQKLHTLSRGDILIIIMMSGPDETAACLLQAFFTQREAIMQINLDFWLWIEGIHLITQKLDPFFLLFLQNPLSSPFLSNPLNSTNSEYLRVLT
jgi:hypothetical protein